MRCSTEEIFKVTESFQY